MASYAKSSSKFLFGSDYLGRDVLSRLIFGTRVSLPVGFMGALTALVIGLISGCQRSWRHLLKAVATMNGISYAFIGLDMFIFLH